MTSVRDLTVGYDSTNPPTYKPTLPLSSGHMIQFRAASLTDESKIMLTIRCVFPEIPIRHTLKLSQNEWNRTKGKLSHTLQELPLKIIF